MIQEKNKKELSTISLRETLVKGNKEDIRALFSFDKNSTDEHIIFLFNLWSRFFFPKFFKCRDASFHHDIDLYNLQAYRGTLKYFVDIAFRGAAKTTRTKLFVAFAIANDRDHFRRFIKVLSSDFDNSKQCVTDVYNLLISAPIVHYYSEIFVKTPEKREETMASFTTATNIKMTAGTVGTEQRGDVQDESRPDFIWFEDFETRTTLRSAVKTKAIGDNMEEAKNGLAINGAALYNCNYISERGNVHELVQKGTPDRTDIKVMITPIWINMIPTWLAAYTVGDIVSIEKDAKDFAGEYLCEPSAGADVFFDRTTIDKQIRKTPKRTVAGLAIFHEFDPSHRYGMGGDIGGGVGLDSSTEVFIDFTTLPNRVAATFKNNTIKPDVFGYQIIRDAEIYGQPIVAPENNKYDMCIGVLKMKGYPNIYFTEIKETRAGLPPKTRTYGWNTNSMTKPKMMFELKKAVEDGLLELSDPALIAELRSYSRDDLMDAEVDARLTTRHFDLLIACAIAWQMRNFAEIKKEVTGGYVQPAYERSGLENE